MPQTSFGKGQKATNSPQTKASNPWTGVNTISHTSLSTRERGALSWHKEAKGTPSSKGRSWNAKKKRETEIRYRGRRPTGCVIWVKEKRFPGSPQLGLVLQRQCISKKKKRGEEEGGGKKNIHARSKKAHAIKKGRIIFNLLHLRRGLSGVQLRKRTR